MKNTYLVLTLLFLIACKKEEQKIATPIKSIVINSIEPSAGSKNALILLSGSGFSEVLANNVVTLNGKNCAVIDGTSTELIISIPPAAGSGNIKVSADGGMGTSPNFEFLFTYTVSDFAGSGNIGYDNGQGANASFYGLVGMATDAIGNIYICEQFNNTIRKINPNGLVSAFAGSGAAGNMDGVSTNAQFNRPFAIAIDDAGIIYIADNHTIKKITTNGNVATIAGSSAFGFVDNVLGLDARFNLPSGIIVNASGSLFVSDSYNNRIRKIIPLGLVSTYAGNENYGNTDGNLLDASFYFPGPMVYDNIGNLFIMDYFNHSIRKITPAGIVSTIAGGGQLGDVDGQGLDVSFTSPSGIAIDAKNNIYITDLHKIKKITPNGYVSTIAGNEESGDAVGIGEEAKFNYPFGMAFDGNGNLFVADNGNNKVKKITID